MDYVLDDAPDFQLHIGAEGLGAIVFVFGHQGDLAAAQADAFDGEFAVEVGDDDVFIFGLGGAIHDQEVAGVDAGVDHGIAGDADEIGGGGLGDEVLVEVELAFEVILGRRGKAGRDTGVV